MSILASISEDNVKFGILFDHRPKNALSLSLFGYSNISSGVPCSNRLIPNTMDFIRSCRKKHRDDDFSDYDIKNWLEIDKIRHELAKDMIMEKCLLTQAKEALDNEDYDRASAIQLMIKERVAALTELYDVYKKNLL